MNEAVKGKGSQVMVACPEECGRGAIYDQRFHARKFPYAHIARNGAGID
jgi:hypothetical protein